MLYIAHAHNLNFKVAHHCGLEKFSLFPCWVYIIIYKVYLKRAKMKKRD